MILNVRTLLYMDAMKSNYNSVIPMSPRNTGKRKAIENVDNMSIPSLTPSPPPTPVPKKNKLTINPPFAPPPPTKPKGPSGSSGRQSGQRLKRKESVTLKVASRVVIDLTEEYVSIVDFNYITSFLFY